MALQGACKHMLSTLRHGAHSQRPERACNASALVNASHCHLELKQTIRQADCLLRISMKGLEASVQRLPRTASSLSTK